MIDLQRLYLPQPAEWGDGIEAAIKNGIAGHYM
jgi:hypothetical protein